MATSTHSQEHENFYRICRVVLDLGTEVLRHILKSVIPPESITLEIKKCSSLKLNPSQMSKINSSVRDGYKYFDISLLYSLIRCLCPRINPTNGWLHGFPPSSDENELGDDVERIHFIRNAVYGHVPDSTLSDTLFNQYWEIMEGIITRLDARSNGQYTQDLMAIKTDCMDNDSERFYLQTFEEMKRRDEDVIVRIQKIDQKVDRLSEIYENILAAETTEKKNELNPQTASDSTVSTLYDRSMARQNETNQTQNVQIASNRMNSGNTSVQDSVYTSVFGNATITGGTFHFNINMMQAEERRPNMVVTDV